MARKPSRLTISDPYQLFLGAISFQEASTVVADHMLPTQQDGSVFFKTSASTMPYVVLDAFALELYLKCIDSLETGEYWGTHDFEILFGAIPHRWQGEIEKIYDDLNSEIPDKFPSLMDAMRKSPKAFEDWRYAFESEKQKVYECSVVVQSARLAILNHRPDWRVIAGTHQQ